MKMVMIICPENRTDTIRKVIAGQDVHAYSELHEVSGAGEKGMKFGNRVWPGQSVVIFTVVPEGKKAQLFSALRECRESLPSADSLHAFVVPVEEVL